MGSDRWGKSTSSPRPRNPSRRFRNGATCPTMSPCLSEPIRPFTTIHGAEHRSFIQEGARRLPSALGPPVRLRLDRRSRPVVECGDFRQLAVRGAVRPPIGAGRRDRVSAGRHREMILPGLLPGSPTRPIWDARRARKTAATWDRGCPVPHRLKRCAQASAARWVTGTGNRGR